MLAKQAEAQKLVMTHFDAENYQTLKSRQKAQQQAKKVFPRSIAACDGFKIKV